MKKLIYDAERNTELCTASISGFGYIPVKTWKETVETSGEDYRVIGETAFAKANPEKDRVVLAVFGEGDETLYRVKDSKFSRVKGYLPVGQNEYLKVVGFNPIWLLVFLFLLVLIGAAAWFFWPKEKAPETNRYIEEVKMEERNDDPASTRYRFQTTMYVVKHTIQNMNFENLNDKKQLEIKIKLHPEDTEYIYESGLIPEGKMVTADVLKSHAEPGEYQTIAECFSYTDEGEKLSQTNFEIKLIVE